MAFDQTITRGTTSKIIEIVMRDATTGQGATGVNAVNLTAYYVVEGGTATAHTQPANGLPGATYTAGVWAEVDSTNMPGVYQFHLDNAMFSGNQAAVTLYLVYTGALNKIVRFCVLDADLRNATDLGLANLDAAVSTRSTLVATDIITGPAIATTTNGVVQQVASITNNAGVASPAPTNWNTLLIGTTTPGAIDNVTLVATCTANSDMRGTNGANTVAPDNAKITTIDTNVANIVAGTATVTANDVTIADGSLAKFATFNTGATVVTGSIAQLSQGSAGGSVNVSSFDAAALAQFATLNTQQTSTNIAAGSVIQLMQDEVTLVDATQVGLAKFVTIDTGQTAVTSGSVAQLAQGSAGGSVTVSDITQAALAKFVTEDTGQTAVGSGSVAELSQGSSGGSVTVGDITSAALAKFVTEDTSQTAAATGSVALLSQASTSGLATSTDVSNSTSTIQTDISNLNDVTPLQVENAVWDAAYASHTGAGTFGKLLDTLRKSNLAVDGTVAGTPTNASFGSNLGTYGAEAFQSALLLFVSGALVGESKPILTFAANGDLTFEEEFSQVPQVGDEFVILPQHIHAISEIQQGLLRTNQAYTATAQSGDTIQVTLT